MEGEVRTPQNNDVCDGTKLRGKDFGEGTDLGQGFLDEDGFLVRRDLPSLLHDDGGRD